MLKLLENLSEINIGKTLFEFKDNLFKSKKYWIIYLIFIAIATLSAFNVGNFLYPAKELIGILVIAVFGVFIITFYSYHNSNDELYKTAFVIIILLGLLCCFLNPICNVSDETEHLARADITSQGILFPEYVNNSFQVSSDIYKFFEIERTSTVFDVDGDTNPVNTTLVSYPSAFQQNPFFGYLPQAIGLVIAKILNLIYYIKMI